MGFICNSTKRFGYGSEFSEVYGRLVSARYNLDNNAWECDVVYYASVAAREYHRLLEYCRALTIASAPTVGSPVGVQYKPKPDGVSQEDWDKTINTALRPNPNILFAYRFGCSSPNIGPVELNRESVMPKLYADFQAQCEPGSVAVTVDTPIEEIYAAFLAEPVQEDPLRPAMNTTRAP